MLYLVLGCFLEGVSMIVLTASVVLPMVKAVGIDPVWFGIYVVVMVELAQITPPVGFNLFILQAMTGRDIVTIARASLPFFSPCWSRSCCSPSSRSSCFSCRRP